LFDEDEGKLKVKINKIKEDTDYDVDEVTVSIISLTEIHEVIHVRTIIDSMRNLEEGYTLLEHIRKVIYLGCNIYIQDDKHIADIEFVVISNVEKE